MAFRLFNILPALALCFMAPAGAPAGELISADSPVQVAVDHYIDQALAARGIVPAPEIEEAGFLRRVTLDLCGRIPTVAELDAYLNSTDSRKKERLVDGLLASPDFEYHLRNEFDLLLQGTRTNGEWRGWLHKALHEGRTWPEIFRQLMLAREEDPAEKHAAHFLKSRASNIDDLTNDTSRLFFGVSINCAKCHDHPLVPDWKQDHYFGMASFFSRTYVTRKNFLAESDQGTLAFRTKAGQEKQAIPMFLSGYAPVEPAPPELTEEQKKLAEERRKADQDKETPPEPPAFSRRALLVEAALHHDSGGYLARAFVNRTWARLLGAGLVQPLDQMHSGNRPSHPELLDWLARDVAAHQFDVKRLIRGLVLSRAYARGSRWEHSSARPEERLFAVANLRPLTPMQFAAAVTIAAGNPFEWAQRVERAEEWANRRRELEDQALGLAAQFEIPAENFQVSVTEALLFANGERIQNEYLRESADRLVGQLQALSDRSAAVNLCFRAVYSRLPDEEERSAVAGYLAAREDRPAAAWQQVVWAMLTSGEFRFNY